MKRESATVETDANREPTTVRPPFDPAQFARDSESRALSTERISATSIPTVPPIGLPSAETIDASRVPLLAIARDDLEWFDMTPLARTALAHVDGEGTVAAISERLAVSVSDVVSALYALAREGVIVWR